MTLEIDGLAVNCVQRGAGGDIVLLEGWGTKLSLYEGLIEHLAALGRVTAFDFPGHGLTPEPREPMDAAAFADFTLRVLAALGIEECALLGHSNGGRTILKLLTRERLPIEVTKAVLIDSAGIVRERTAKEKLSLRAYKAGRGFLSLPPVKAAFPDALEALRRRRGSADYKNATPIMRQTLVKLVNEDLRDALPRIKTPVLLIWGEKDTDTPMEQGELMERLIPGSGLVRVPGAGHYSYLEAPGLVYRVLDSFLGA